MSDESALITRAQETLSHFILSIGFLMVHEIGVISSDRLFSVIFFQITLIFRAKWDCNAVRGK